MRRVAVAWSGGKDAALALHRVQQRDDVTVDRLVTTVAAEHDRVTIHGVRTGLLRDQAAALDIPLELIPLPPGYTRDDHDTAMTETLARLADDGIDGMVYADIFLDEVREAREAMVQGAGLDGVWPLWGEETAALAEEFLGNGFTARLVCIDAARLDESFAGRRYTRDLLAELPGGVDPCGENGAFHTFVTSGPCFQQPLYVEPDGTVTRQTEGGTHHYARLTCDGGRQ